MANPDYCTASSVRAVLRRASSSVTITDAEIVEKHDIFAKPAIDGALSGRGAPFTAGSAPSLIQSIACLLTAASLYVDIFHKADKKSEFADGLVETAKGWLEDLRSGAASSDGILTGGGIVVTDPTSDRGHTQVIVGDETDWEFHGGQRADS